MQDNINKKSRNEQGQPHGYWEVYYTNTQLSYKGNYINGQECGVWVDYYFDGDLLQYGYYAR